MTVVITGIAGGIGRAAAAQFKDRDVVGQDLNTPDSPSELARQTVAGDLRDALTLEAIKTALGDNPLDTLVLAHGIAGAGALRDISDGDTRRIMSINFESVIETWEYFRSDLERSRGTLVVLASQAAVVAEAGNGVYCASKSALLGWARGMDAQTGVRLRVLCPGATETPLLKRALEGMAASQNISYEQLLGRRNRAVPVGRLGRTEEMGAAIRWLADLRSTDLVTATVSGGEVLN
ncbi:SDR family NAD(P)-dependent oxidoreductase [Pseudarthrobacter enclensis]|uniref:NAD(P)-dependent dehydrogenase (Short-subunit alcohol dehydrogenase family) n=1 Tax=Pseudarthrobacter enclensis TaxID=993070 RepID=A0ABT9RWD0_9MICC|nr:SDR family oxidoreductase [Pseudarthrobacter enclensis]MDP9889091.1 NAD(P)-dependent dehydrogenase (short-subunit alcohol dehydrogenase family) [Pseudarthrobacter enclensis]